MPPDVPTLRGLATGEGEAGDGALSFSPRGNRIRTGELKQGYLATSLG